MSQHKSKMNFGFFGNEIISKLRSDNDAKVVVIGKNSATGIGKSTLAIQLCRFVCNHFGKIWNPREYGAYWNVDLYFKEYNDRDIPSPYGVLLDEIEAIANRRDWMTRDNKTLIGAWSRLRNRNVFNVATLPSTSQLDVELLRLADYLIIVEERGVAKPYWIKMNDFTHKISYRDEPFNGERIQFNKIPKSDDDYDYIEEMKTSADDDFELIRRGDAEKEKEREVELAKEEVRNKMIRDMYEHTDLSYKDISQIPSVGVNRQHVGRIVRGEVRV